MSDNSYQLAEDGQHIYVFLGENSSMRIFNIDLMSFIDLSVSHEQSILELNNFVFTTRNEGEGDYFIPSSTISMNPESFRIILINVMWICSVSYEPIQ